MIKPKRSKPRPGRLKGEALDALRVACYERDGGRCISCGRYTNFDAPHEAPDSFHMAHIKGKRMWGDHIDNVQCECGDCHRTYHQFGPSRVKPVPAK